MRLPLLSRWLGATSPARKTRSGRGRYRPLLEVLEERALPSSYHVKNTNESGPDSLRAEIALANANPGPDTIVFDKGVGGTIKLTSGELLITDSVTINGPGANKLSVSGNNASSVFDMTTGLNVAINGLTITHGFALGLGFPVPSPFGPVPGLLGGGILNQGSDLTLSADVLSQNVVLGTSAVNVALGGGLGSLGGDLTITGCTFTGNQALGGTSSEGIAVDGAIASEAGNVTISNSTFTGNQARASNGVTDIGASHAEGGAMTCFGLLTITGSTFSGNSAVGGNGGIGEFAGNGDGGAIISVGPTSISGSEFDHNQAIGGSNGNSGPNQQVTQIDTGEGGAIASLSTLSVTNSSFSHNLTIGGNNATATGTDFVLVGFGFGGAIDNSSGGTATISGCTFDHNQALGGQGNSGSGAVVLVGTALGGAVDSGSTTTTVSNSTLSHNDALGGDNNTGTATVAGLVGAGVGAGIANLLGGTTNVSSSELDHGQARGGHGNTATAIDGGTIFAGLGAGAGIFNWLGNFSFPNLGPVGATVVTVTNCTLDHNLAQEGGGGNGLGGGIANLLSATTTVSGSFLLNNQANGDGGGAGQGGGAYNDASCSLTLKGCLVTLNQANGNPGQGGGVFNLGTFSHTLSLIILNHASTSGDNIGP
jgi:hypothetical protein